MLPLFFIVLTLVRSYSDFDVLHYFNQLRTTTVFKTSNWQNHLRMIDEILSPRRRQSVLGFHAITGFDQKMKFYSHSKKSC